MFNKKTDHPRGSKKLIGAWTWYDWANSVYSLVISSAIFPIYYSQYIFAETNSVMIFDMEINKDTLISSVSGFSFLIIAIILGFILYRKKTNYNPEKNLQFLSILSLSFIISRLSPYIIIPGLNSIISMPPPETLAILSFWYVIIISIIFLFLE